MPADLERRRNEISSILDPGARRLRSDRTENTPKVEGITLGITGPNVALWPLPKASGLVSSADQCFGNVSSPLEQGSVSPNAAVSVKSGSDGTLGARFPVPLISPADIFHGRTL